MTDKDIKEAIRILGNNPRIQLLSDDADKEYCAKALSILIDVAQLYLTIAGMEGMPKEKTKIQDNRNYEYWEDKGFNLARQECILALRILFPQYYVNQRLKEEKMESECQMSEESINIRNAELAKRYKKLRYETVKIVIKGDGDYSDDYWEEKLIEHLLTLETENKKLIENNSKLADEIIRLEGNDLADAVIALSKAICPDGSITLVTELVDFAKDLQHAYKVVSKLGEKDICDICHQDIIGENKSDSDYAICKKCLASLQDDNS